MILLNITYLFEVIWGLNNLNFTSDNKIYPNFCQFWGFWLFQKAHKMLSGIPEQYLKVSVTSTRYYLIQVTNSDQQSRFKLIPYCSKANISPHTKFHQNGLINIEFLKFCYESILVGQAGRSKNGGSHFKLILCCSWVKIIPHTKF